ncbi:MAG: hypothetical protein MESAZ_02233 [Saezia sanguinis]
MVCNVKKSHSLYVVAKASTVLQLIADQRKINASHIVSDKHNHVADKHEKCDLFNAYEIYKPNCA